MWEPGEDARARGVIDMPRSAVWSMCFGASMSGEGVRRTVARVRTQILVPRSAESRVVGLSLALDYGIDPLHGKPRRAGEPPDTGRVIASRCELVKGLNV